MIYSSMYIKKTSIILLIVSLCSVAFAQTNLNVIKQQINKSNYFYLADNTENRADVKNKYKVSIVVIEKEDFVDKTKQSIDMNSYPDYKSFTFEKIKDKLKNNENIYKPYYMQNHIFDWVDGNTVSCSVRYGQLFPGPISNAGYYNILVFDDDYIYSIHFSDSINLNKDFDKAYSKLTDIFIYKKGQKADAEKGLEQTDGLYFIDENCLYAFYEKLNKLDRSLPKSALRFQKAKNEFLDILTTF